MIGIYKITNPKLYVYIGQSVDINRRFRQHKIIKSKYYKNKLYNSIKKYGHENHKFEVIEECDINLLNERERHWQDYYNRVGYTLNLQFTETNDKSGYLTEYHKQLLRKPKNNIKTKHYKFYVLNLRNGIYYNTISEASIYCIYSNHKLRRMLLGRIKNTTDFVLV